MCAKRIEMTVLNKVNVTSMFAHLHLRNLRRHLRLRCRLTWIFPNSSAFFVSQRLVDVLLNEFEIN